MGKSRKIKQPRKRWLQYSLRALLLLTAAVSLWLGVETRQAHQQQRVMARVQELGGTVGVYYRLTGTQQNVGPTWFWNFVGEGYAIHIADVDLTGTSVSDRDLEIIGSLRHLQDVSLPDCSEITDRGLACLKATNLGCLALGTMFTNECQITAHGVKDIAEGCPTLDYLTLGGPSVDDTWLASLSNAKQLKWLWLLGDTRVTEAGITALQKALPELDIQTPETLAKSLGLPADAMTPVPMEGGKLWEALGAGELRGTLEEQEEGKRGDVKLPCGNCVFWAWRVPVA